jgi:hypothetical protein
VNCDVNGTKVLFIVSFYVGCDVSGTKMHIFVNFAAEMFNFNLKGQLFFKAFCKIIKV